MSSSVQDASQRKHNKLYPKPIAPVKRPNPIKPNTLIWAHTTVDFEYRATRWQAVPVTNGNGGGGKTTYKLEKIASGRRLIGIRVDLMNGANFNDPAPFMSPTYGQLMST